MGAYGEDMDFYAMKGASEEEIRMAEQTLGLCFAADYHKYIAAYGVASFAGHELTGICKSKRLSVIDVTIDERNNIPVPTDWYVLEQANIDGIVIWQDSNGTVYQTAPNTKAKKMCESLAEYIEYGSRNAKEI